MRDICNNQNKKRKLRDIIPVTKENKLVTNNQNKEMKLRDISPLTIASMSRRGYPYSIQAGKSSEGYPSSNQSSGSEVRDIPPVTRAVEVK